MTSAAKTPRLGTISDDPAGASAMLDDRWEQGSDFHLSLESGDTPYPWTPLPHTLWGTGRDALRALIAWGRDTHGWCRLLVPSYFCQEVIVPILREIPVDVYDHAPTSPSTSRVNAKARDVVLVASMFGMPTAPIVSGAAAVVEDFSHDLTGPLASHSTAAYAFASFRKTLPLPDGGVVWSPRGLNVPPELPVTLDHASAVLDRLSAMTLKAHYLAGQPVAREEIRRLAKRGEAVIGLGDTSGISPFSRSRLATLPAGAWRAARETNLAAFVEALGELPGFTLLDAPYAATLVFEKRTDRDRMRAALVAARIYPAVLWSLDHPVVDGIPEVDVDLAGRILSIHCDYRYAPSDMVRVADVIRGLAKTL